MIKTNGKITKKDETRIIMNFRMIGKVYIIILKFNHVRLENKYYWELNRNSRFSALNELFL